MSVKVEIYESAGVITIDRPEQRNALNADVREGIRTAMSDFEGNDAVRCIILTASGDQAFSAGADLKEMAQTGLKVPPRDFIPDLASSKPVIAAVNGLAFGGGFFLVQQADIVIAAPHATFGITEARHGRGAPWAHPLPLLIPPRVAIEMLVTAEPISAQRAYEIGLVNQISESPLVAAQHLARTIAANAPLSVAAGKAMVRGILSRALAQEGDLAQQLWERVYLSEDAQEGPKAFSEKRPPRWQGR